MHVSCGHGPSVEGPKKDPKNQHYHTIGPELNFLESCFLKKSDIQHHSQHLTFLLWTMEVSLLKATTCWQTLLDSPLKSWWIPGDFFACLRGEGWVKVMFKGDSFQQIMVDMKNPPLPVGVIGQLFVSKNSWTFPKEPETKKSPTIFLAHGFYSSLKKSPLKIVAKNCSYWRRWPKCHTHWLELQMVTWQSRGSNGKYEWQCWWQPEIRKTHQLIW